MTSPNGKKLWIYTTGDWSSEFYKLTAVPVELEI